MPDIYHMTEAEVLERGGRLFNQTARRWKVHGVPRGGTCALLYLIAAGLPLDPVLSPVDAELILDDIVDGGATKASYAASRLPFLALVDRSNPSERLKKEWVVFPWEQEHGPEDAVLRLLEWVGEDTNRDGLKDTPKRVVKSLREMTAGYHQDPRDILGRVFEESYDEIVVLRSIPFVSLCEHHMLPFYGTASIGYLPSDKVVGLSKLARLVDCFSQRLQMQERLTREIGEAIRDHLSARGVAVLVRGYHSCMSCRGVRKPGAEMVTSVMMGVFRDKPEARAEVLSLLEG